MADTSDLISFVAISPKDMKNLCSCVYCWTYKDTYYCNNCSKKYCKNHIQNHACFKNLEAFH